MQFNRKNIDYSTNGAGIFIEKKIELQSIPHIILKKINSK